MNDIKFPVLEPWIINLLEKASDTAFEIMREQARINPEAMEALYG